MMIRYNVFTLRVNPLKDLHEVAPYYNTREHIVTDQGILIEQTELKYLGIIFDNTLKFSRRLAR